MSTVKIKRMTVRCPKCGERFEVDVPIVQIARQMPSGQIPLPEVQYIQTYPEETKIWERRKKELEHQT